MTHNSRIADSKMSDFTIYRFINCIAEINKCALESSRFVYICLFRRDRALAMFSADYKTCAKEQKKPDIGFLNVYCIPYVSIKKMYFYVPTYKLGVHIFVLLRITSTTLPFGLCCSDTMLAPVIRKYVAVLAVRYFTGYDCIDCEMWTNCWAKDAMMH